MLVKCPECDLQVSDKALSCPHCGYPFTSQPRKYNNKKRMRLPNGFGQITEIKTKRLRNPFRAMITVGKDEFGKPICRLLKPKSYFSTYNEAYEALVEYHKNPYDLDKLLTVQEVYDKWLPEYAETLKSQASVRTITSAWDYCSSVYDLPIREIRARHIKYCIEHGEKKVRGEVNIPSANTRARIKSVFNLLLDYALEYELIDKNYARTFSLSDEISEEREKVKNDHVTFTEEEISVLWKNVNRMKYVDLILIQCYSGWRPQELGLIKLNDTNITNWTFTGGMKTSAGTGRTVPIHRKIRPLVERYYHEAKRMGSEYLFNYTESGKYQSLTYDKYYKRFVKIRDELKLNIKHRPHDPRKHFVTTCKKYHVDEYAIKYMVGHNITDITEKTYTERNITWLKEEIDKIR